MRLALIHGLGLDQTMWDRCLPLLAPQCAVQPVELLGHGGSPNAPRGVTLSDLATAVARQLQPNTHLVGFSLGGLVALRLALDRPDLVRSLVLISTIGLREGAERTVVRRRVQQAENDFAASIDEMIRRWFRPAWRERDADLASSLAESMRRVHRPSYLACYKLFERAELELWPQVAVVDRPTTVLTGAEDTGATPAMAELLATTIPGARHTVVPDAAHLLPLERPGEVADAVLTHLHRVTKNDVPRRENSTREAHSGNASAAERNSTR